MQRGAKRSERVKVNPSGAGVELTDSTGSLESNSSRDSSVSSGVVVQSEDSDAAMAAAVKAADKMLQKLTQRKRAKQQRKMEEALGLEYQLVKPEDIPGYTVVASRSRPGEFEGSARVALC